MTANVGTIDRIVRLVLGLALIVLPFVTGWAVWEGGVLKWLAVIVGLVLAGTAAMRTCPLYSILGIRTNAE